MYNFWSHKIGVIRWHSFLVFINHLNLIREWTRPWYFLDRPAYFRLKEHRLLFSMKFIKDWNSNRRRMLEYKCSINFLIADRKNVNEIKRQVIRMFVFLNNGGTLSIIGVIMKAFDDSKSRSAPLVTGLLQYWVFIIFIWMLDCFSNSDIDRSVFTRRSWSPEPLLNIVKSDSCISDFSCIVTRLVA